MTQVGAVGVSGRPHTVFAPLKNPAFVLLLVNALVFIGAVTGQTVARSWVVLETTGSSTLLGAVQLSWGVAMLVGIPIGGAVTDRFSRRTVIVAAVTAVAVTSLATAASVASGWNVMFFLVVSAVGQGLAFAFYSPARLALTAEVVGEELVGPAVALSQVGYSLMLAVGPAMAGLLVAWSVSGPEGVFAISGVLCALVALSSTRLPRTPPQSSGAVGLGLSEAVRYIRASPPLGKVTAISFVVVLAGFPFVTFVPALNADLGGGALMFGGLSAVIAVGSFAAGLMVATASVSAERLQVVFVSSAALLGVALIGLGINATFVGALVLLGTAGGAMLAFQSSSQAWVMHIGESRFHGRLQSVLLLGYTANSLAALPLGVLADLFGVRVMLAGTGVVVAAVSVISLFTLYGRPRK